MQDYPDAICVFAMDGEVDNVNKEFCKLFETDSENVIGKKPESIVSWISKHRNKLSEHASVKFHEQVIKSDGTIKYIQWILKLVNQTNKSLKCIAIGRDITELKESEENLNNQLNIYKTMVESATHPIFILNGKGVIIAANKAHQKVSGYKNEELVGKHFTKLPCFSKDNHNNYTELFKKILKDDFTNPIEIIGKRKDGIVYKTQISVNVSYKNLRVSGVTCIVLKSEKYEEDSP
ncbi:MAG: PAS domain S-box protein [Nanoarchaeota archaeon]|nr:PAS domain S-box protein [Nanoarchaeota archaeon]